MSTDFGRGVFKALEAPRKSLHFNSGHKPVLSISSLEEAFLFPHISQTIATSPYLLPLSSINILVLPSFNMEAIIIPANTFLAKLFLNIIERAAVTQTLMLIKTSSCHPVSLYYCHLPKHQLLSWMYRMGAILLSICDFSLWDIWVSLLLAMWIQFQGFASHKVPLPIPYLPSQLQCFVPNNLI